jgi:hypothetical protein
METKIKVKEGNFPNRNATITISEPDSTKGNMAELLVYALNKSLCFREAHICKAET